MLSPFQWWVADTIQQCGGDPIAYINECNQPKISIYSTLNVCQSFSMVSEDCRFLEQYAYPVMSNVSVH